MDSTRSVTAGDRILYTGSWLPEYSTRAERGIRLLEEHGDSIHQVAPEVYEVPSCTGRGVYRVVYGGLEERCDCPDAAYHPGRPCKHLLAVGAMHAAKRSGVKVRQHFGVVAGDPFAHAGRRKGCPACFAGYVTLGGEDDEGHPGEDAVPCRRCHGATRWHRSSTSSP